MAQSTSAKSPVQIFALVFGAVYVLIGILGFLVAKEFTGGSPDHKLILFPVNHLHNIVHLGVGAAWLASSRSHLMAKQVSLGIGAVYLIVALLGFVAGDFMEDLLNIDTADNFLHLASGALGVYFGTVGAANAPASSS